MVSLKGFAIWSSFIASWLALILVTTENKQAFHFAGKEQKWSVGVPWVNPWHGQGEAITDTSLCELTDRGLEVSIRKSCDGYHAGLATTSRVFAQKYGTFQFRASFPVVDGIFPTIWMLPADLKKTWPPEIDLFGLWINKTFQGMGHYWEIGTAANGHKALSHDMSGSLPDKHWDQFHDYKFYWDSESMTWYVDGQKVFESRKHIPDEEMYLVVSIGKYGKVDDSKLPAKIIISEITAREQ